MLMLFNFRMSLFPYIFVNDFQLLQLHSTVADTLLSIGVLTPEIADLVLTNKGGAWRLGLRISNPLPQTLKKVNSVGTFRNKLLNVDLSSLSIRCAFDIS